MIDKRYAIPATLVCISLVLAACAPVERKSASDAIVLQPWEETDGAACTVGYELRYPADTPAHERVIEARTGSEIEPGIPEGALRGGGGALPIPRPEADPRVDRSADGMEVFRVRLMSFNRCVSERYGDRYVATVAIEIGECASGPCPPVTYRPPSGDTTAVFRLSANASADAD
jgi:hypothetical protein